MSLPLERESEARLSHLDGQELKSATFRAVETLVASAARRTAPGACLRGPALGRPDVAGAAGEAAGRSPNGHALLIVCVFRPERAHRSWRLRETAARDHGHRHTDLWLDPLSAAESERLVGNLLWMEHLPRAAQGAHPGPRRGQSLLPGGGTALPDRRGSHRAGGGDRSLAGGAGGERDRHPGHPAGGADGPHRPAAGGDEAGAADGGGHRADLSVPGADAARPRGTRSGRSAADAAAGGDDP